jgi:hypothetical protein
MLVARWWVGLGCLAILGATSGCAAGEAIETASNIPNAETGPIAVRVWLTRREERYQGRVLDAATHAWRHYNEWFGALRSADVLIASSALGRRGLPPNVTILDVGLLAPSASARIEQQLFHVLADRYWQASAAGLDPRLRRGLVEFSADRLRRTYFTSGPYTEVRSLYGLVPWVVRSVPVGPEAEMSRAAIALTTLERHLGWAALQQVLAEWRARADAESASTDTLIDVAQELTGRPLDWARDLFRPERLYDFVVESLDVRPLTVRDGYRSRVVLASRGAGTGTVAAVMLRVVFADGQQIMETWRPADRTEFIYEAGAPVQEVVLDPDRVFVVDSARENNLLVAGTEQASLAARSWAARWGVWLQDRLLLLSSLL